MTRTTTLLLAVALLALPTFSFAGSEYKPNSAGVSLEVAMLENGRVNVKGARVREVTESGFRAETLWGSAKLSWMVTTGEDTPITRKDGTRIALTQVTPGDYVSFTGSIQANMAPFTITADAVRDWSITNSHVMHSGTITAIDTENRTFTLVTGEGRTVTVRADADTAYAQSGARVFSDLSEGDTVLAFGTGQGGTLAATKVNLTERAYVASAARPRMATGLGSWVDNFLPRFFSGRLN